MTIQMEAIEQDVRGTVYHTVKGGINLGGCQGNSVVWPIKYKFLNKTFLCCCFFLIYVTLWF